MRELVQFLPGIGLAAWAVVDRRPLAFAAAAVALVLAAAATPFVLRDAPAYALRLDSGEEVATFVAWAGLPALMVAGAAGIAAGWRDNAPLPTAGVAAFVLALALALGWVLFIGAAWAL